LILNPEPRLKARLLRAFTLKGEFTMKSVGRISLFIGALLLFTFAILSGIAVGLILVSAPSVFFSSIDGGLSFAADIAWFFLYLIAGAFGMKYASKGEHKNEVFVLALILTLLVFINLTGVLLAIIQSGTSTWTDWENIVYGSIGSLFYGFGYYFDRPQDSFPG
jgi:phosphate starvation-inducible membrane PsiE